MIWVEKWAAKAVALIIAGIRKRPAKRSEESMFGISGKWVGGKNRIRAAANSHENVTESHLDRLITRCRRMP
jgi:hypothetical protein